MRPLRPHQTKAIDMLRLSIMAGKRRPMLQAPTGFGKTLLAAAIVQGALSKGKRVVFTVPAISLIDQTVQSFMAEGIDQIGVIQASHEMTDPAQPIQVASVQTLQRREFPRADIVVVDEAHRAHKVVFEWMDKAKIPFVGLSATPWTKGLGKHYDDLIIAATTQELIDGGYLSPFRVFAPSHPDLSGVRTTAGDYNEADLSEAMDKPQITADVVETWLKLARGRPTLCFGVDRAHAKSLQAGFEKVGVQAAYMDAFTDMEAREQIRRDFESGRVRVVCNVGVLTTGVDWDVRCLVLARPTKSEMLFTQIVGRALRTASGKEDALILDHTDTTLNLGFVTDIHHETLDMGRMAGKQAARPQEHRPRLPKECTSCSFLKPAGVHKCPNCGFAPAQQPTVEVVDGELEQVRGKKRELSSDEKRAIYGGLLWIARDKGYADGWCAHKFKERCGVWPNHYKHTPPLPPTPDLLSWLKSRQIAWAAVQKKIKKQQEARHAA
jgi:superfamily II DNA or RNA helicase